MFSVPDIAVIGVLALLLFGPDKLPGLMRQAGKFMRDVQNTSHSFVSEMERAADVGAEPRSEPRMVEPLIAPAAAEPVAEPVEEPIEKPEPTGEHEPTPQ
ncbi:MAG: twin-arginine translocase TatA/TatE family subunit [Candidatus Eremiobacteraeota bacterium]|nr:twin-arginine translocase TatA/TatE family subunit [Candidatus Eremiobacteraeota bacterium]